MGRLLTCGIISESDPDEPLARHAEKMAENARRLSDRLQMSALEIDELVERSRLGLDESHELLERYERQTADALKPKKTE